MKCTKEYLMSCSNSNSNSNSNMNTNTSAAVRTCLNCGKRGHFIHACNYPAVSHGVIVLDHIPTNLITTTKNEPKFLMICRKDSFGFIDLVRGKYSPSNIEQIQTICDSMTMAERAFVLTHSFSEIWEKLWGRPIQKNSNNRNAEQIAKQKFEQISEAIVAKDGYTITNLETILLNSETTWEDAEWEFPKGKRNAGEKDCDCAIREFYEETGLPKGSVTLISNAQPITITFTSNKKNYAYKYFLGVVTPTPTLQKKAHDLTQFQVEEVSKLEWKTAVECIESLRGHHEKQQLILQIQQILLQFQFICISPTPPFV